MFCVSLTLYDCPLMFTRCALWVSLSTIAATRTLSFTISPHLSKDRFVVMIVAFFPALSDRWLNNSSPPSLSQLTYPNSSQMTISYFSNLSSSCLRLFCDLHSLICVSRCGTDVKKTVYPSMHALIPNAVAICVFPVPGFPYNTTFLPSLTNSSVSSSGMTICASL